MTSSEGLTILLLFVLLMFSCWLLFLAVYFFKTSCFGVLSSSLPLRVLRTWLRLCSSRQCCVFRMPDFPLCYQPGRLKLIAWLRVCLTRHIAKILTQIHVSTGYGYRFSSCTHFKAGKFPYWLCQLMDFFFPNLTVYWLTIFQNPRQFTNHHLSPNMAKFWAPGTFR